MSKEPQLNPRDTTDYLYASPLEYEALLTAEYPSIEIGAQLDAWEGKGPSALGTGASNPDAIVVEDTYR